MSNWSDKEQLPILKTVGCLSVQYGYPFWQPLTHPAAIFTISITVIFPRKTRLKRRIEENIHTEWIYFRRFEIKIFFSINDKQDVIFHLSLFQCNYSVLTFLQSVYLYNAYYFFFRAYYHQHWDGLLRLLIK